MTVNYSKPSKCADIFPLTGVEVKLLECYYYQFMLVKPFIFKNVFGKYVN